MCQELRVLIIAIGEAVRHSLWMFLLLFLVVYVAGIFLAQLCVDTINEGTVGGADSELQALWQHFGTLPRAMDTLFLCITGGKNWGEVAGLLSDVGWLGVFILTFYVAVVVIVLLNVMTGLFCECAVTAALKDQDEVMQEKIRAKAGYILKLKALFRELDDRGTDSPPGMFTLQELEKFLVDPHIEACFASLEIEAEDAWTLFKLLDTQERGYIEFDQFLRGCLKCRGVSRSMDTHLLRYEVQWIMDHVLFISKRLASIEFRVSAR
mmetsp:Transcript_111859/g.176215  ORF Transcript_111859/g.176215 Transcript_111859/m.176215 type:complete len:266 (+) Transcript_111859:3-800(+)